MAFLDLVADVTKWALLLVSEDVRDGMGEEDDYRDANASKKGADHLEIIDISTKNTSITCQTYNVLLSIPLEWKALQNISKVIVISSGQTDKVICISCFVPKHQGLQRQNNMKI